MVTTRKFHGIRKAASETAFLATHIGRTVQIAYDPFEDRVLTHFNNSYSSCVEWADDILPVCTATDKMTMSEIREAIVNAIKFDSPFQP